MHSEHHSLLLRVVVSGWKTSLFFMQTFQELVVGYQFLQSKFAKCYKKTRDIIFFVTESLILSVSEVGYWLRLSW